MKYTIEEASTLVKKSIKSIYRHMAQNGLRYEFDNDNRRVIEASELESFYKIKLDTTVSDSQMRILNENENENIILEALIEKMNLLSLEVKRLSDNQEKLLNQIHQNSFKEIVSPIQTTKPEDDPKWPKKINSVADILLRDELKKKYKNNL